MDNASQTLDLLNNKRQPSERRAFLFRLKLVPDQKNLEKSYKMLDVRKV